jgi:hypothetical protein
VTHNANVRQSRGADFLVPGAQFSPFQRRACVL